MGLAALTLLLAALAAELVLPSPLDPWTPPLLEAASRGRVRVRAGVDPARWPLVPRTPTRPRIVWMGASTVVGAPFDPVLSPPRWLEHLLRASGADVDVLAVAAPGKAARDLLRWLPEVLELSPSAIVLSTGHNEYLDPARHLARGWTERSALLHAVRQVLGVDPPTRHVRPTADRPFAHTAVAGAFRRAIGEFVARCEEAGVPLLLCAPVSNLADCPPVLGDTAFAAFRAARERLEAHDPEGALPLLLAARDADEWPARATSLLEDALRWPDVPVVDMPAAFGAALRGRPPGFESFVDHCHPTPAGQRRMAVAVLAALREQDVLPASPAASATPGGPDVPREPNLAAELAALGFTPSVERLGRIRGLRSLLHLAFLGGPANPMIDTVQALVRDAWQDVHDPVCSVLLSVLAGDGSRAAATAAGASPSDRAELLRLLSAHPWVEEAFARAGLHRTQLEAPPPPAAADDGG